jgi:hypothetical protein
LHDRRKLFALFFTGKLYNDGRKLATATKKKRNWLRPGSNRTDVITNYTKPFVLVSTKNQIIIVSKKSDYNN